MTDVSTTASGRRKFPSELKIIPCTVAGCNKKFNRPARLVAHMRSHNNERPYKCTHEGCDKAYSDNKYLKSHIISAHTKEAKFICSTCGKGFATGQRLNRHGLVHQGEERYRCREYPPCNESFRKHQTLQRHILKDHLDEKPFRCGQEGCTQAYDTANALKRHTTRDHGEIRYWCDECSAAAEGSGEGDETKKPVGFTTHFLLEQHIRSEHVNCIFCDGMKFHGQYELELHINIYHSGQSVKDRKTVVCEFEGCEKKFVKKYNMRVHYKSAHEGLRYVCGNLDTGDYAGLQDWNWAEEGCGQAFATKGGLVQHVTYVHLGKQRQHYEHPANPEPEQAPESPSHEMTFLNDVSGVTDYERRQAVCSVPGCIARFVRYADLNGHVRLAHPEVNTYSLIPASVSEFALGPPLDQQAEEQIDWAAEDADVLHLLTNLDSAGDLQDAIDPELFVGA